MAELRTDSDTWDELLDGEGRPRPGATEVVGLLEGLGLSEIQERQDLAEIDILSSGITFAVYGDGRGVDRAWPFDVIPRVIAASEWRRVERGLKQRLKALNLFIDDIYNDQKVITDGVFPAELLDDSVNFRSECRGIHPAHGVWAHISGSDLVRDSDGQIYVLEDNLRVPSGVSYMLENRSVSKRVVRRSVHPPEHPAGRRLHGSAERDARVDSRRLGSVGPTIAVLTPGVYNSAYFEHSFLAQRLGAVLVEGRDLMVDDDDCVYMRTIDGHERVHVIYRRIDDLFIDPEAFREDSVTRRAGA